MLIDLEVVRELLGSCWDAAMYLTMSLKFGKNCGLKSDRILSLSSRGFRVGTIYWSRGFEGSLVWARSNTKDAELVVAELRRSLRRRSFELVLMVVIALLLLLLLLLLSLRLRGQLLGFVLITVSI